MHVKIENLANRPVLLRCNSGQTLHLPPKTTSVELPDVEVKNNSKVQKLKDRHVIALHEAEKKAHPAAASTGTKKEKSEGAKEREKAESTRPRK